MVKVDPVGKGKLAVNVTEIVFWTPGSGLFCTVTKSIPPRTLQIWIDTHSILRVHLPYIPYYEAPTSHQKWITVTRL